jgi:regulator of replication initiation timing
MSLTKSIKNIIGEESFNKIKLLLSVNTKLMKVGDKVKMSDAMGGEVATITEMTEDKVKLDNGKECMTSDLTVVEDMLEDFIDDKLIDGTMIRVLGELKVGTQLSVAVDGNYISAPDGTHETEGGMLITTKDGLITEFKKKEVDIVEEVEEKEIMNKLESLLNEIANYKTTLQEFKSENTTLKSELSEMKKIVDKTFVESKGVMEEMKVILSKISDIQVVTPVQKNGGLPNLDKYKKAMDFINKIKNQ